MKKQGGLKSGRECLKASVSYPKRYKGIEKRVEAIIERTISEVHNLLNE
jgi:hypothetical protein